MARPVARFSRAAALPESIAPQLTQLVDAAPEGDQWLHEIKFDGYRLHARLDQRPIPSRDARSTRFARDPHPSFDAQRLERPIRSTSSSLTPRPNPHRAGGTDSAPPPRDFVPWRFSDAGLRACGGPGHFPPPKTRTPADP